MDIHSILHGEKSKRVNHDLIVNRDDSLTRKYEKSEKNNRFRFIYSKHFSQLEPIWIYIGHCMTSLLKLEITVVIWLLLPVYSGSLKRIAYPLQSVSLHTCYFQNIIS